MEQKETNRGLLSSDGVDMTTDMDPNHLVWVSVIVCTNLQLKMVNLYQFSEYLM